MNRNSVLIYMVLKLLNKNTTFIRAEETCIFCNSANMQSSTASVLVNSQWFRILGSLFGAGLKTIFFWHRLKYVLIMYILIQHSVHWAIVNWILRGFFPPFLASENVAGHCTVKFAPCLVDKAVSSLTLFLPCISS